MAWDVIVFFAALIVWVILLVRALRTRRFGPFLIVGIALMAVLNVRYLIEGPPAGIAFFIGIYDVLNNLGVGATAPDGMSACAGNACSVWGEVFQFHTTWGVAFFDRFLNAPELRTWLLYGHLTCNSLVFILMHVQMARPGGMGTTTHAWLGRVVFAFLTIGVGCAVWLASEHGPVGEYGGSWSMWGFYSMSAFVYGTAVMGVAAIRAGNMARHRVWMWRFAGSMWGSFWVFRVMLFVLDPLLRDYPTAAILICIWASAPIGIVMAELIRRRIDGRVGRASLTTAPA